MRSWLRAGAFVGEQYGGWFEGAESGLSAAGSRLVRIFGARHAAAWKQFGARSVWRLGDRLQLDVGQPEAAR